MICVFKAIVADYLESDPLIKVYTHVFNCNWIDSVQIKANNWKVRLIMFEETTNSFFCSFSALIYMRC